MTPSRLPRRAAAVGQFTTCTLLLAAPAWAASPIVTGTDATVPAHVKAFNGVTLAQEASFFAYPGAFTGGVRVAAGDVNGDGRADYVTGTGSGVQGHVKAFDGLSSAEIRSFFAYPGTYTGGIFVASGDIDGDRRSELITGTGAETTHVKAFDGVSSAEVRSFLAFPGFTGGVRVAAGDVNGDGFSDIVVGTGVGGGHVKVFDGVTNNEIRSFLPYGSFAGGVFVAAGDVNGDGKADLVTGTDAGVIGGHVKVFDSVTLAELRSFFAYDGFAGGVRVAAGDVNGDGLADVITGSGVGASHVKAFSAGDPGALLQSFLAYPGFNGGVFVAGEVPEPAAATTALVAAAIALSRRRVRR